MTEDKLTFRDALLYPKAMIVKNATKYINIIAFIVHHPISDEMQYEITNCKLILRTIEQLTDEEKEYIDKKYMPLCLDEYEPINLDFKDSMEFITYNLVTELIDYLRSINIDIDGFLKSGKAVKG